MRHGNRSLWKKIISSPFTVAGLLIVFGLMSKATWNVHKKADLSLDKLNETNASLVKVQARKDDLSQKVSYLSTDEGIKSEIRDKFRATEEGESVAVIVDNSTQYSSSTATTTVAQKPWWRRILGL